MNQPRGLLKLLKLDSLVQNLIEYFDTRVALVKADVKDDILKAMRAAMIYGAIAIVALYFVFFLSFTLALVLNAALESSFWGFVIVTGIYLITLIVLYALRNSEKVKNMFGDGSLAFLKKDQKQEEQKKKEKEQEQQEEAMEREAALREMEYQRKDFEQHQRPSATSSKGRTTEIRVEKKEQS